jgi:ubiquitin-protein ligase E3 C
MAMTISSNWDSHLRSVSSFMPATNVQYKVNRENSATTSPSANPIVELIPHGSSTPVTKHNLLSYIYLYANFKLNVETGKQSRAFLSGFRDLIPLKWIRIFSAQEIQLVIGGDGEKPLDLVALQAHCTYSGGYHPSQPYIQVPFSLTTSFPHSQEFWRVIESFPPETQREFLRFVTSCSRQPILGFGQLSPPFNIMKIPAYVGDETAAPRLPMASACFNQFKLPIYDTIEELRAKVLYAIQSKSGFELT